LRSSLLPVARPKVFTVLIVAHVVLKVSLFPYMSSAPLHGDERYYFDSARALSNLVRDIASLGTVDVGELQRNVVGNGWFMPGNGIVLTPLFVVDPGAGITTIRLYLGVLTTLLLLFTVMRVREVLGDLYAAMLLVFPGLIPMWLLFSFGGWSDLVAGLLIVLLLAELVKWTRALRLNIPPTCRDAVRMALIAGAVVYSRSSASLLVAVMGAMVMSFCVVALRRRALFHAILAGSLVAAIFGALLAPWSLFASHALDSTVVTTTSVPTSLAVAFGNPDELCYGPCDPTSTQWFTPVRYAREVARATGTGEVGVLQQMSSYSRHGTTPKSYAQAVLDGFSRYALHPAAFSRDVRSPDHSPEAVHTFVVATTNLLWLILAGCGAILLLTVVRGAVDAQIVSLLTKLGITSLLTQPFVHVAGSRYWTSVAPLCGIGAALLVHLTAARRPHPRLARPPWTKAEHRSYSGDAPTDESPLRRCLTAIQAVQVILAVVIAVSLVLFAKE